MALNKRIQREHQVLRESFPSTGSPNFVLVSKLKALKTKLKEWNKSTRDLGIQNIVAKLVDVEEIKEHRQQQHTQ